MDRLVDTKDVKKFSILLVEDHDAVAMMHCMLEQLGCAVDFAWNGHDAIY
jgi:CheY-like chemotaxis protein